MSAADYEPVIGLEIHVQLATRTKMFCGDVAAYGGPPNARVCPVCLGLPGALPVVNGHAVELGVRAALGLGCTVRALSRFDRKNYVYPDLPKGYQITQHAEPLAVDGSLDVAPAQPSGASAAAGPDAAGFGPVRIQRVHLEEDAGRLLHDRLPGRTAIDLNRAGIPLIEVVTRPDLRSPGHARAFLTRLRQLLRYLEVSDCEMETGSLRVDANLSVRPAGTERLGARTEIKNLNSFASVERALAWEFDRQVGLVAAGRAVRPATLLWDADAGEARPMRTKDELEDYRYFPEPDLAPLVLGRDWVAAIGASLPEPPAARARRFRDAHGLPAYDADVLTAERPLADYFEAVAREAGDAKAASNWVMTEVLRWQNEREAGVAVFPVPASRLAELIRMVAAGAVSGSAARTVFDHMAESGRAPAEVVVAEGLARVGDAERIEAWVREALEAHPDEAARLRQGESKLVGFFMGLVMRASGGAADPAAVRRRLERAAL